MKGRLVFCLVLGACHWTGLRGSGRRAEEARPLTAFTRIDLKGSTNVTVTAGQAFKVVVSGDDNIVPHIRTRVAGDTLVVDMDDGNYWNKAPDQVTVSMPILEGVAITGSGDVDARNVSAGKFAARITGSGDLKVSGKANELEAHVTGSGDMSLFDLAIRRAEVDVAGSGNVQVSPSELLEATVAGSGDIRYRGSPRTSVHVSGSGSVNPG
jgi:hypothetical protein